MNERVTRKNLHAMIGKGSTKEETVFEMTENAVIQYGRWLMEEEKSKRTIEKYLRDIRKFYGYLPEPGNRESTAETPGRAVCRSQVLAYKAMLAENYAVSSMNTMLIALNGFFAFMGWHELQVKTVRCQRRMFCAQERELSKEEYFRLVQVAAEKKDKRLSLLLECICSTGIRVSEVPFITVQAANAGRTEITLKGKNREIFLPNRLCRKLLRYAQEKRITAGSIFLTRTGNPLDRSNIWKDMKKLCEEAKVSPEKVFPHNLRHLFARSFYQGEKDIVYLADVLGHSSIETTRIYTTTAGKESARRINHLGLIQ